MCYALCADACSVGPEGHGLCSSLLLLLRRVLGGSWGPGVGNATGRHARPRPRGRGGRATAQVCCGRVQRARACAALAHAPWCPCTSPRGAAKPPAACTSASSSSAALPPATALSACAVRAGRGIRKKQRRNARVYAAVRHARASAKAQSVPARRGLSRPRRRADCRARSAARFASAAPPRVAPRRWRAAAGPAEAAGCGPAPPSSRRCGWVGGRVGACVLVGGARAQ